MASRSAARDGHANARLQTATPVQDGRQACTCLWQEDPVVALNESSLVPTTDDGLCYAWGSDQMLARFLAHSCRKFTGGLTRPEPSHWSPCFGPNATADSLTSPIDSIARCNADSVPQTGTPGVAGNGSTSWTTGAPASLDFSLASSPAQYPIPYLGQELWFDHPRFEYHLVDPGRFGQDGPVTAQLDLNLLGHDTLGTVTSVPVAPGPVLQQPAAVIVCSDLSSTPSGGRRPIKDLQCGICNSPKLFDRGYELQRHMLTHQPPGFPCPIIGCHRIGAKGFPRKDKLRSHLKLGHKLENDAIDIFTTY